VSFDIVGQTTKTFQWPKSNSYTENVVAVVAIRKPKRHVRKASHCRSKQQ